MSNSENEIPTEELNVKSKKSSTPENAACSIFSGNSPCHQAALSWKQSHPQICCVCLQEVAPECSNENSICTTENESSSSEDSKTLLLCSNITCDVIVHPVCYGLFYKSIKSVKKISSNVASGDWTCDRCSALHHEAVVCCACPTSEGAMIRIGERDMQWIHVICYWKYQWTQKPPHLMHRESLVSDPSRVIRLPNLKHIFGHILEHTYHIYHCYLCENVCQSLYGSVLRCDLPGCTRYFHASCGHKLGIFINSEVRARCHEHHPRLKSNQNWRLDLNSWSKWVSQRPKVFFCDIETTALEKNDFIYLPEQSSCSDSSRPSAKRRRLGDITNELLEVISGDEPISNYFFHSEACSRQKSRSFVTPEFIKTRLSSIQNNKSTLTHVSNSAEIFLRDMSRTPKTLENSDYSYSDSDSNRNCENTNGSQDETLTNAATVSAATRTNTPPATNSLRARETVRDSKIFFDEPSVTNKLFIVDFEAIYDKISLKNESFKPKEYPNLTRQTKRFHNDLYLPLWTRGIGKAKEGMCRLCPPETWFKIKISAYWYHMNFHHGVSQTTGRPYRVPEKERFNGDKNCREGFCHQCKLWVNLDSVRQTTVNIPEIYWWKHAQKCHQ